MNVRTSIPGRDLSPPSDSKVSIFDGSLACRDGPFNSNRNPSQGNLALPLTYQTFINGVF
jgi:hypothetical protein